MVFVSIHLFPEQNNQCEVLYSKRFGGGGGTNTDKAVNNFMTIVLPREAGPWGPPGGRAWDDGVYAAVDRVFVKLRDYKGNSEEFQVLQSIQFCYKKKNGELVTSLIYGGLDELPVRGSNEKLDKCSEVVEIDCLNEELVGIEGFYGPLDGKVRSDRIMSLTFCTKKKMYGPYGAEIGTSFSSTPCAGKVVGFFGRSGRYLTAIGIHMEYD